MSVATDLNVEVSVKELIESGVHFGHPTAKWNPKMKQYIHNSRNGVYVLDLRITAVRLREALEVMKRIASSGQKVLFVGTKRQAQDIIKEEATRAGQYYVTERWIGGTLTNFKTIKRSIGTMKTLQRLHEEQNYGTRKKKEILLLEKRRGKLETNFMGIRDMGDLPGALFVIDPKREYIAVNEARTLGIPIFGIVDTNCDPDGIDYVIPGNDDSMRAIRLYCSKFADAILEGIELREQNIRQMGGKAEASEEGGVKVEKAEAPAPVREVEVAAPKAEEAEATEEAATQTEQEDK